jgi:acetyl-CoA acetyltransferase
VKHVYDGFSPMVWTWIEAFGWAEKGTAHQWAQPETIGRDGPHPLNMSGGNLGSGRVHGFGHVLEAAMQLMGTAGVRQVKNNEVAPVRPARSVRPPATATRDQFARSA